MVSRPTNAKKKGGRDPSDLLMSNREGTHWAGPLEGVAAVILLHDLWASHNDGHGEPNRQSNGEFPSSSHPSALCFPGKPC